MYSNFLVSLRIAKPTTFNLCWLGLSEFASCFTRLLVINLSFEWCVTFQKVAKLFKMTLCCCYSGCRCGCCCAIGCSLWTGFCGASSWHSSIGAQEAKHFRFASIPFHRNNCLDRSNQRLQAKCRMATTTETETETEAETTPAALENFPCLSSLLECFLTRDECD